MLCESGNREQPEMPASREALSAEFVGSILDYDPITGVFRWKFRADRAKNWNSRNAGKVAGTISLDGYVLIQIGKGVSYRAHVLAWLLMTGEWLPGGVDHHEGVRADNRFSELRKAGVSENNCNKAKQRNNKSGVPGVFFNNQRRKWEADISKEGRRVWRKFFPTLDEASRERAEMLAHIHGEFAIGDPARAHYRHSRDHV
jgi:hypothetical protein